MRRLERGRPFRAAVLVVLVAEGVEERRLAPLAPVVRPVRRRVLSHQPVDVVAEVRGELRLEPRPLLEGRHRGLLPVRHPVPGHAVTAEQRVDLPVRPARSVTRGPQVRRHGVDLRRDPVLGGDTGLECGHPLVEPLTLREPGPVEPHQGVSHIEPGEPDRELHQVQRPRARERDEVPAGLEHPQRLVPHRHRRHERIPRPTHEPLALRDEPAVPGHPVRDRLCDLSAGRVPEPVRRIRDDRVDAVRGHRREHLEAVPAVHGHEVVIDHRRRRHRAPPFENAAARASSRSSHPPPLEAARASRTA